MKNREKIKSGEKVYMQIPVEIKTVDKEKNTLEAVFSTQDTDRHGDVVMQEGFDLTNFKKNPVILNSHNYYDATEVIGKASDVRVEKKKLQGTITFAVDANPKARVIFDLYAGGFLSAFSVGFIAKKYKENKDGTRDWYTIEEAELLEVSAVSVPANARALAKQKGIDVDALPEEEEKEDHGEDTHDEVPKDNEVPPADGEGSSGDSDGGEDGGDEGDDADQKPTGSEEDKEAVPQDDTEEKHIVPYKERVIASVKRIDDAERDRLRKVAAIVDALLHGRGHDDKAVDGQIRKRKMNQAIRILMKTK